MATENNFFSNINLGLSKITSQTEFTTEEQMLELKMVFMLKYLADNFIASI